MASLKEFKLLIEKVEDLSNKIEEYNTNLTNKITELEEELERVNKELIETRNIVDTLPENIHSSLQVMAASSVTAMKPSLIDFIKNYCDEMFIRLRG